MRLLLLLAAIVGSGTRLPDVEGVERDPLKVASGETAAVFFVSHDCPISNFYSQEIRRICEQYGAKGLRCSLVYVDPRMTNQAARHHAQEYAHGSYPRFVDRKHSLVAATRVTVTPEVVVVRDDRSVAYTGRIDDFYVALGQKRQVVTERDLRDALDAVVAGRPVKKPRTKPAGCYIPDLSAFARP